MLFRRRGYNDPAHRDKKPRWHIMVSKQKGTLTYPDGLEVPGYLVKARCGYEYMFSALLGDPMMYQAEVKTKTLRCKKCDEKEASGK